MTTGVTKAVSPVVKRTSARVAKTAAQAATTTAKTTATTNKKAEAPASPPKKVSALQVGDTLPDLTFPNEHDQPVRLHDLVAQQGVIFFLYPKANTPGCTKQACGFQDSLHKIKAAGYTVIGLSADKPKSQMTWKVKYNLEYSFLCDTERVLIRALTGLASSTTRSHVVVGKGGVIEDLHVKISPLDSVNAAVGFIGA